MQTGEELAQHPALCEIFCTRFPDNVEEYAEMRMLAGPSAGVHSTYERLCRIRRRDDHRVVLMIPVAALKCGRRGGTIESEKFRVWCDRAGTCR